jgi:hypothetical protein
MKKIFVFVFLFYLVDGFSQTDSTESISNDFENFKKREITNFENYKEQENIAFANFLKQAWKAYDVKQEIKAPLQPIPLIQPVVVQKPIPQPDLDKLPKIILDDEKIKEIKNPTIPKHIPSGYSAQASLVFYGTPILIGYNKENLCYCGSVSEDGISKYWSCMSKSFSTEFIDQINIINNNLSLNDWAKYLFAKKIADAIYKNDNDKICFQFFILNQINLDAKVAKSNNSLVLLLPTSEILYGYSYLTLQSRKYYVMSKRSSGCFTFDKSLTKESKPLNVNILKPLNFDLNIIKSTVKLKNGSVIKIGYNKNVIDFYNDIPQAEFKVLFNSKISTVTEDDLVRELTPHIVGLNQLDAVNYLLHFVQHSFEYKTDDAQFGREKWFYPEDMFCYPYSDCEDHSVLFAYLVKKLLNMKVIGLNYPSHVATAILFNGKVNGDFISYNNSNYLICDPTYIGSDAGMTMPQFKNSRPEIINID